MADEPSGGQPRDLFLGSGLAGQAGVAGDDGQVALAAQLLTGPAVEAEDNLVLAVHDQQRGRAHQAQLRPGQVGPAILAGNRRHRYPRLGRGRPQRRGRRRGYAEVADREAARPDAGAASG
jgi:hypothetical protein